MNWNKANNVLIIAYILVCIGLGYIFFSSTYKYNIPKKTQAELQENMQKYDILINEDIPKYVPLQRIKVEREVLNIEEILNRVFKGGEYRGKSDNGVNHYYNDRERIIMYTDFSNEGTVVYEVGLADVEGYKDEDEWLKKYAKKMISTIWGENADMKLKYLERKNTSVNLRFNSMVGENTVFCNYLDMTIENDIIHIQTQYVKTTGRIGEKHYILSADQILYKLTDRIISDNEGQNTIMQMEIGYDSSEYLFDDAKQDYIEPYYRIKIMETGKEYYVNAYTNELAN